MAVIWSCAVAVQLCVFVRACESLLLTVQAVRLYDEHGLSRVFAVLCMDSARHCLSNQELWVSREKHRRAIVIAPAKHLDGGELGLRSCQ